MAWSTAIFLIVAMSLCIPLYALRVRGQRNRRGRGAAEREEQLERKLGGEIAELRDRVETLERIVTDQRYGLDQEFDRLRTGARRSG